MPQLPSIRRVEILEGNAEAVEHLPARIDALTLQIVQFREDVRIEISATRRDLTAEFNALRAEVAARIDSLSAHVDFLSAHLDSLSVRLDNAGIDTLHDQLHDVRNRDEETRRSMRVLHEQVIARITAIREARPFKR